MLTVQLQHRNTLVWSSNSNPIIPREKDVIGGRGKHAKWHPGNLFFTQLVESRCDEYYCARSPEKRCILQDVLKTMMNEGRRFLTLECIHQANDIWVYAIDPRPMSKIGTKIRDSVNGNRHKSFKEG